MLLGRGGFRAMEEKHPLNGPKSSVGLVVHRETFGNPFSYFHH